MRRHPLLLTLGLAPTVGEFLLGNIPISQYGAVLLLCPLYGAGAVLVREVGRRWGAGWPSMVLLAAAYALVEEGPVDQMVFNPGYLGLPSFAGQGEIPGLGISTTLVVNSLALHTIWSICVPIAVVEAFDPEPTLPWLGGRGRAVTAAVFGFGCVFLGVDQARSLDFVGTPAQFLVSALVILALVVVGLALGRRPASARVTAGRPPRPLLLGLLSFAATSGYWLSSGLPGGATAAGEVARGAVAVTVGVVLVRRWSRQAGWTPRHRLALAAGATATYATWFGPAQALAAGTSADQTAVGALVLATAMLTILLLARRAVGLAAT